MSISTSSTLSEESENEPVIALQAPPSAENIPPSTYLIKPPLQFKFRAQPVKNIINSVLAEQLNGKDYNSEDAKIWTKNIANGIRDKVRELNLRRFKIVVQVHLGEQKGAGVKSGIRCLWDSECDNYTSDIFMNVRYEPKLFH